MPKPAAEVITTPRIARDYQSEKRAALSARAHQVADILAARDDGSLGEEVFKLAQAMILCTLPYRPTTERQITRRARLGDGSVLKVTFTAVREDVPMAYGADRKLLTWIFDRAIQSDVPFVPWASASEYHKEVGIGDSGKNVRDLRERFRRITGLVITIERTHADKSESGTVIPVVEDFRLPASLAHGDHGQNSLPGIGEPYGFKINERLWRDIKKHNVAIPRQLWLHTKTSAQVQDILLWLYYRCYSAASESLIPWDAIRQQLPQEDSNPRRLKSLMRSAVKEMLLIWPQMQAEVVDAGLLVGRASAGLLPDDERKKRQRLL